MNIQTPPPSHPHLQMLNQCNIQVVTLINGITGLQVVKTVLGTIQVAYNVLTHGHALGVSEVLPQKLVSAHGLLVLNN